MFTLSAIILTILGGHDEPKKSQETPLKDAHRVVFLGDSITYAGQWIEFVEAYLDAADPTFQAEFLNLGLPSETVSGLSEPGHAGGAFPRPVLNERLGRVLDQIKPDLILACYGMNDGIYYPFSEERFEAFRQGIESLRRKTDESKLRLILLTPTVFDPEPIKGQTLPGGLSEYRKPFVGYDEVLERYSAWLLQQRKAGWKVVDIHTPLKAELKVGREQDPGFRLADDGVHLSDRGHWLIAREVLKSWGYRENLSLLPAKDGSEVIAALPNGLEILKLVQSRQRELKDSWLTATGHKRPGMTRGKPIEEALADAKLIEAKLQALRMPKP